MKLAVVPLPLYFTNFYHILNAATRPAEMIHMILHNIVEIYGNVDDGI